MMTVNEMLCGNADAHRLWWILWRTAHIWDDMIDRDRVPTPEDVDEVFWSLLAEMPLNRFYQANITQLHPLIVNACLAYKASVVYEREKDTKGLEIGHVLRYQVANVLAQMILIVGGKEHADRVLPEMYKLAVDDRLEDYQDEIADAQHI